MKYKVGFYQFKPELLNVQENLGRIEKALKNIDADLIVLPELATSGYVFNSKEEVFSVAEEAENGITAKLMKRLAKDNDCSFVIGFPENYHGALYNSSMLVNPDSSINVYRKIHLFDEEKFWFEQGNSGLNVFEAKDGVKVGLMICFDWIFPESARTLALKGAEVLCHASNLVLPWCQQAMITRSLENRVFSITCNRYGKEINGEKELYFTGQSQVLGTKGEILYRSVEQGEKLFVTEIDTDLANIKDITNNNNIFDDLRPEMYY